MATATLVHKDEEIVRSFLAAVGEVEEKVKRES